MTPTNSKQIITELMAEGTKLGDIKKLAKGIKMDHDLAQELWAAGGQNPRLLATLIFDKKLLTQELMEGLASDMQEHEENQRNQLVDWLLANQLMKGKATISLLESWQKHELPLLRRLFWYHQARLRWTGQTPPDNSVELLDAIERDMADESPEVQWAMNFCAGWIGIYEPGYRSRCIELGRRIGLYKDEKVAKNCTPSYLPEFIRIEVAKRK